MTMIILDSGEVSAGGRRRASWNAVIPGLKNLCALGVLLFALIGLTYTTYLEAYLERLQERRSESSQAESFPAIRQSFLDSGAPERWLKASEEATGEVLSFKATGNSGDFVQEASKKGRQEGDPWNPVGGIEEADPSIAVQEAAKAPATEGVLKERTRVALPADESEVAESLVAAAEKDHLRDAKLELPKEDHKPKDRQGVTLPSGSRESADAIAVEPSDSEPERLSANGMSQSSSSNSTSYEGQCDLTAGKWVQDPAGPLYSHDNCRVLSQPQNCQQNGRPDNGYEFYKWEPDQCSIPRMDVIAFLELMRGKTLAFLGDSLARNQMESLLCILLQGADAVPKGSKNIHRWYFPSHKFTIVRIWSSWLAQTKGEFPPSLAPEDVTKVNLTEIDEDFTYHLPKFDVIILSSGHWWLRKIAFFLHGELVGGMGWPWPPSLGVKTLDHVEAFGIAINTILEKMGAFPGYKGLTIFRTYTPDHYTGGSWDTGGSCTGETKPYDKGPTNSYNDRMYGKQIDAYKYNTRRGEVMPNGSKLRMLDVFPILNYRGDGHPGPYRSTDPLKKTTRDAKGRPPPQDCLHWCMPGPIDSMNELLFHILREELR